MECERAKGWCESLACETTQTMWVCGGHVCVREHVNVYVMATLGTPRHYQLLS